MKYRVARLLARGMVLTYFALFVALITWIDNGLGPLSAGAYGIYAVVTSLILFFLMTPTYTRLRTRLLFFGLYAACLTVAYLLPLSPCEPLVNALHRVRPGMTRAEVAQTMHDFQEDSYRPSAREERLSYVLRRNIEHDGDRAIVDLLNGRVVETSWHPED